MSNKVYLIHQGCRYEGGATVAAFKTYKGAKDDALQRVQESQKENNELYEWAKINAHFAELKTWKEEKKNIWSDGYDIISIKEFNLLP